MEKTERVGTFERNSFSSKLFTIVASGPGFRHHTSHTVRRETFDETSPMQLYADGRTWQSRLIVAGNKIRKFKVFSTKMNTLSEYRTFESVL